MTDISALASVTRAALVSGGNISSTEHNTWSTNVITQLNAMGTPTGLLSKLESNWASASQPGDKPAGKIWYDSANSLWKGYATASGTPVQLGGISYGYPDIVARLLNVVGADSTNSGTAFTSTGSATVGAVLKLPANSLNANGRAYRATYIIDTNGGAANATIQLRFNAGVLCSIAYNSGGRCIQVTITLVRISTTVAAVSVMASNDPAGTLSGFPSSTSSVTVTNWTSDINFDVNISAWASGTIRSLILGEQVG